jgi:anti-sigma regulatory factor (Ser/Thr protein kinase)
MKSSPADRSRPAANRIDIKIPGRPEYVVVVRLAAAAIGGRMQMSFDEIADLKLAVGEMCSAAILTGAPDVAVGFTPEPARLEVEVVHRPTRTLRPSKETEINRLLVQVLMDEVETSVRGGVHTTRMVKRAPR